MSDIDQASNKKDSFIYKQINPQTTINIFWKLFQVQIDQQEEIYNIVKLFSRSPLVAMTEYFCKTYPQSVKELIKKLQIFQAKQYKDKVKQNDIRLIFSNLRKDFTEHLSINQHVNFLKQTQEEQEKHFNQQRNIPRFFQQEPQKLIPESNELGNDEITYKKQTKQISSKHKQQLEQPESQKIKSQKQFIKSQIDQQIKKYLIKQRVLEKGKQLRDNLSGVFPYIILIIKCIICSDQQAGGVHVAEVVVYGVGLIPNLIYWIMRGCYRFCKSGTQNVSKQNVLKQNTQKQSVPKQSASKQDALKQKYCCVIQRLRNLAINSFIKKFLKQREISQQLTKITDAFNEQQRPKQIENFQLKQINNNKTMIRETQSIQQFHQ